MKNVALACFLATCVAGCEQNSNTGLDKKLDSIDKKLDQLLKTGVAGGGKPQQPRPPRPTADPAKTYSVDVEGAPSEGPADAPVTIVKAYEYACPFCEKVRPTMEEIKKKYGNDVRFAYKQFVVHPQVATSTALAACAAHKQGKFVEMDNALWEKVFKERKFDRDRCWTGDPPRAPAGSGSGSAAVAAGCENVDAIAKELGLNIDRFHTDMKESCMAQIQKEQKEMQQVGVGATPAFYVNGRFVSGAQPFEQFAPIIDEELKKAKERIAGGTPKVSYYKTWVVEKGEKQAEVK